MVQARKALWKDLLQHVSKYVKLSSNHSVLDVGGVGTIFLVFDQAKRKYVVDLILNYALPKSVGRFSHAIGITELRDVTFISRRLEECNFDSEFDLIFCLETLDHVDNLYTFVNQMHRLSNQGVISLSSLGAGIPGS